MKKRKTMLPVLLAVILVFVSIPIQVEAATVKLNKTKVTVYVGKTTTLKLTGTNKKATWTSSNKKIATVKNGKVTGKKAGTVTITAKVAKEAYTCKVTVKKPYISETKKTLKEGNAFTLKLVGTKIASAKTSDENVATVSKKGKVTAKKVGTATITLKGKNGKNYKCKVTVNTNSFPTFTGGNITLGNIGITVPTLNEFNKYGLDKDTFWYSDDNTRQIFADNGNAIMNATGIGVTGSAGNGFTVSEYYMDWAYSSYSAINSMTLKRDTVNKYYVLEINVPLDKDESVLFGGKDMAPTSRDLVKFMISVFSSTPKTVYNKIYKDLYIDSFISTKGWTTIGDCKVQFDYNNSSKGHYVYKFKAK